jgi:hypothetical protein
MDGLPGKISFRALINGGDWACANACHEGLAEVCTELAARLEPELGGRAIEIATMATRDLEAAIVAWEDLRACLIGQRTQENVSVA